MTLTCPNCGAHLGLSLAAVNGDLAVTPSVPQVAANGAASSLASTPNLPQVASNGHVEGEKVLEALEPTTSTKKRRFNYTDPLFLKFWGNYPRRIGKAAAYRKWVIATREVDPELIITAARIFADRCHGKDPQYIPYPEGWLNAGRWEDEEAAAPVDARYEPTTFESREAEYEVLAKQWDMEDA